MDLGPDPWAGGAPLWSRGSTHPSVSSAGGDPGGTPGLGLQRQGKHGVEITFRAGHRILIGTQDPERFMRAVDDATRPE